MPPRYLLARHRILTGGPVLRACLHYTLLALPALVLLALLA